MKGSVSIIAKPSLIPFKFTNTMFQRQQKRTRGLLQYVRSESNIGSTGRDLLQLTRVMGNAPVLSPGRPIRR